MSGSWRNRVDSYVTVSEFMGTDRNFADSMYCAGVLFLFILQKENEGTCILSCTSLYQKVKKASESASTAITATASVIAPTTTAAQKENDPQAVVITAAITTSAITPATAATQEKDNPQAGIVQSEAISTVITTAIVASTSTVCCS